MWECWTKLFLNIIKHFEFPDHHRYSQADLGVIEKFCRQIDKAYSILTTEKDMVKIIDPRGEPHFNRLPWFYVPINQVFLQDGLKFDELILGSVRGLQKN